MTLTQAKDQVAQRLANKDWNELMNYDYEYGVGLCKAYSKVDLMDIVTKLYATEKVKEALKLATATAKLYVSEAEGELLPHFIGELETELVNQIQNEI